MKFIPSVLYLFRKQICLEKNNKVLSLFRENNVLWNFLVVKNTGQFWDRKTNV